MIRKLINLFLLCLIVPVLAVCTKKQGKDPLLAYSDKALYDSCRASHHYFKDSAYSGQFGPHGNFKLRFNKTALTALGSDGRLPVSKVFPSGSFIIKDIYDQGQLSLYAFMYKRNSNWIWGEIRPGGDIFYSVTKDPSTCLGCHASTGNRDHVLSFSHY